MTPLRQLQRLAEVVAAALGMASSSRSSVGDPPVEVVQSFAGVKIDEEEGGEEGGEEVEEEEEEEHRMDVVVEEREIRRAVRREARAHAKRFAEQRAVHKVARAERVRKRV